jgi:hypothetical protein
MAGGLVTLQISVYTLANGRTHARQPFKCDTNNFGTILQSQEGEHTSVFYFVCVFQLQLPRLPVTLGDSLVRLIGKPAVVVV